MDIQPDIVKVRTFHQLDSYVMKSTSSSVLTSEMSIGSTEFQLHVASSESINNNMSQSQESFPIELVFALKEVMNDSI